MSKTLHKRDLAAAVLAAVSVFLLFLAITLGARPGDSQRVARRVSVRLESRLRQLDRFVEKTPYDLPADMVIYRYSGDTLKNWHNQFTVLNDNISDVTMLPRMSNPGSSVRSPLSTVTDSLQYMNLGPKWYLVKRISKGDETVIAGLEIMGSGAGRAGSGINPRLKLPSSYTLSPLSMPEGSPVRVNGQPVFKIQFESLDSHGTVNSVLLWAALLVLLLADFFFLTARRTVKRACISAAVVTVCIAAFFLRGLAFRNDSLIFSPILYVGGGILYSLGAIVLVNLLITVLAGSLFLVRKDLHDRIRTRKGMVAGMVAGLLAVAGIIAYTHGSLVSLITNSNISLELYKFGGLNVWTGVVYLSYILMLMSIPMLLQLIQPALSRFFGFHHDIFSTSGRITMAALVALYMVLFSAIMGFEKEKAILSLQANKIAIDRDVSLELQLRRAGNQISSDVFMGPLAVLDNGAAAIRQRILENYLPRVGQDYDLTVFTFNDLQNSPQQVEFLNGRLEGGTGIAENSPFLYVETPSGGFRYDGTFFFYVEGAGVVTLLVELEPKSNVNERGYASIVGMERPGRVALPGFYSYARYKGWDLQSFRGDFAYSTTLTDARHDLFYKGDMVFREGGYAHFINCMNEDELVVISRPQMGIFSYIIAFVFVMLFAFLMFSLPVVTQRTQMSLSDQSYYRTRITWVLEVSLIITLLILAVASVLFVTKRGENLARSMMADRLAAVQTMVQNGIKGVTATDQLRTKAMVSMLNEAAMTTGSDITLYDPDGLLMMSTMPEVFDRMLLGCREDEHAYDEIVRRHKRFFIHADRSGRRTFYTMDAPVRGADGKVVAILSCPYTGGQAFTLERDGLLYVVTIITVFIILLLFSRLVVRKIVTRLFKPLSEMGRKMDAADLDNLELIEYDREDEVSSLVQAYNRMVTELSDSSKRLAEAERNKAWSGMARQVAHDLKNPLTPMKLQIQRLQRLKQKGDDSWQEKFDESSQILLDHINILSETANEFSTFANLYSEAPVDIDLDKLLRTEVEMFDNRENITFDYLGLEGVVIKGPKPQLTRVFDNLIGNAVQAVGDREGGRVMVSLRKSADDGYYDILVEDNGPGVAEENLGKLFTPNFTTKSGGTGLGLAISHSVLSRCEATISYSRSFVLGGACFTIRYPKVSPWQ